MHTNMCACMYRHMHLYVHKHMSIYTHTQTCLVYIQAHIYIYIQFCKNIWLPNVCRIDKTLQFQTQNIPKCLASNPLNEYLVFTRSAALGLYIYHPRVLASAAHILYIYHPRIPCILRNKQNYLKFKE